MKKLREALRRAEERADDLEYEKNDAMRQIQSYKEVRKHCFKKTISL